ARPVLSNRTPGTTLPLPARRNAGATGKPAMTTEYLVLSALGSDRPGIVDQLARTAAACGCNIEDSRMAVMGGEFAVLMLVAGNATAIAAMEKACPDLGRQLDLALQTRRT